MSESNPAVEDEAVQSVSLTDEEGEEYVVDQQNMGAHEDAEGGGEWPDPNTPPRSPAPGAAE